MEYWNNECTYEINVEINVESMPILLYLIKVHTAKTVLMKNINWPVAYELFDQPLKSIVPKHSNKTLIWINRVYTALLQRPSMDDDVDNVDWIPGAGFLWLLIVIIIRCQNSAKKNNVWICCYGSENFNQLASWPNKIISTWLELWNSFLLFKNI